MRHLIYILLFFIVGLSSAKGQAILLKDAAGMKTVKAGINQIFNMKSVEADKEIQNLVEMGYEKHPVVYLLRGLNTYWALYPLKTKPKARESYLHNLELCYVAAQPMLKANPNETEALFFAAISQFMQASVHGELGNSMAAINHTRLAYGWIKEIKQTKKKNAEFAFITGLYDYFRVWYPERHSNYKPLMALFMDGNKVEGLKELEFSAQKGLFTHVNAKIFLTTLNLNYEKQTAKAVFYVSALNKEFPNNWLFQNLACEIYLRAGKYEEAVLVLEQVRNGACPFKSLIISSSLAQLAELKDGNVKEASVLYNRAADLLARSSGIPNHVKAVILAGQARCAVSQGRKSEALDFYKSVKKLENAGYLGEEADKYLEKNLN